MKMTETERSQLMENIYYLNMQELKGFCDSAGIPYRISYEAADGRIARTGDIDRKGIVIDRVIHYLATGRIKAPTVFSKSVISFEQRDSQPQESARVLYGQYKNNDHAVLRLMKSLTGGKFKFGAIAQEVLRSLWSAGKPPTYRQFAVAWLAAQAAHTKPNPEWAYLADLAGGVATSDWKLKRKKKAAEALAALRRGM